jgi:5'-3' exoribonuclease 2
MRETVQQEMRKQDLEYINDETGLMNDQLNQTLIIDYMIICILLGNDFLPHIPSLKIKDGGLDRVINSYKITQARLPNHTLSQVYSLSSSPYSSPSSSQKRVKFNNNFLLEFLHTLADYEETDLLLQTEAMQVRLRKWKFRLFNITDPYEKDVTRWEYIEDQWQDKIQYGTSNWKSRYYNHYLHSTGTEESTRMIENYLSGLTWNLQYYLGNAVSDPTQTTRTCPDWLWKYNYLVAPPVSDIYRYLQNNREAEILRPESIQYHDPVTTDVQLLLILPPQSSNLLKSELQVLMTSPDSPVSFQYPTDFKIDLLGHRFRWECYPILPPIDLKSTETAVSVLLNPSLKQLPIRISSLITSPRISFSSTPSNSILQKSPKLKKLVFKSIEQTKTMDKEINKSSDEKPKKRLNIVRSKKLITTEQD